MPGRIPNMTAAQREALREALRTGQIWRGQMQPIMVPRLGTNNMVLGPHPYAHLTQAQKNLFFMYIQIPHEDFEFDSEYWRIRSKEGIVEPDDDGTEEIIEFTNGEEYRMLAIDLGSTERCHWEDAVRYGHRLLDMGPEYINSINHIIGRQLRIAKEAKKEIKVNWGRDGF